MKISPCHNSVAGHQIATNFAHATTAQLSCHVPNFVAITVLESRWEWNEISIEFELRWKNRLWNGPLLCLFNPLYAELVIKISHGRHRPTKLNTLRPRQNRRHFADDIFKCIFLNENEWISPRISLKFVPKVRINNIPSLVQIMAWRRPGDKPLSEPMVVSLLTHICVTRLQWVNANDDSTFINDSGISCLLVICRVFQVFFFLYSCPVIVLKHHIYFTEQHVIRWSFGEFSISMAGMIISELHLSLGKRAELFRNNIFNTFLWICWMHCKNLRFKKTCCSVELENHIFPNIFIFKTCYLYLDTGSDIYLGEHSVGHRTLISSLSFSRICAVVTFQHVEKDRCLQIKTILETLFQHVETFRLPKRYLKSS